MRTLLLAVALLLVAPAGAQAPDSVQTAHTFRRDGHALRYLLYLPEGYDPGGEAWPLLLFLHGAGERGDSLDLVKAHGPPRLVEEGHAFPFLLVSPQQPPGAWWDPAALAALLDDVEARHRVDPDRVYVTGLSMGGFGTWALAILQPDRFAAIAPVCGGGEAEGVCAIRDVPAWAFHGALDSVVPLARSAEMVDALYACGGNPRFTVYPEADHDSWTETYANPTLYEWLLSHRRGG
jgi:predicted peptidase